MQELSLPKDFILTDEFEEAFDLMENSHDHIYLTGKAGTGKSTLLQYFRNRTTKNYVVLAPTGIAALNVGGETIHSFFGFPARYITPNEVTLRRSWSFAHSLQKVIIDEISMVRADMIDNIDRFLRANIKPRVLGLDHDGEPIYDEPWSMPFGGVQLIMIGDLFQLAPVVEDDLKKFLSKLYPTPYFFSANVWDEAPIRKMELTRIFRQTDQKFVDVLNNIRVGQCGPTDLQFLNRRFNPMAQKKEEDIVHLVTTNAKALSINHTELGKLKTESKTFNALVVGDVQPKDYPTEEQMQLKIGAQVVMLRNDPQGRWVNGTIAKVAGFDDDEESVHTKELGDHSLPGLQIEIDDEVFEVDYATWGKIKYMANSGEDGESITFKETGKFVQVPVKLAWAMTIHKSQGQTFEKAIIDFGFGTFAHGQAYVALSRCKSAEGMYLTRPMNKKDVMFDRDILAWMEG